MKSWFDIQNKADAATVYIHDEIGGWGINARQFIQALDAQGERPIRLHINSPGGSVFDALAIFNHLKGRDVTVHIDGIAASAASIIAMAGSRILMPENTFMMIHDPWGAAVGNAGDMREMADILERIGHALIATYAARTGLPEEELTRMLAEETWLEAAQAVELGFADELLPALEVAACYERPVPEHVLARLTQIQSKTDKEGTMSEKTQPAEDAGLTRAQVDEAVAKALDEAREVVAAAVDAGVPQMAAALVGLPPDEARQRTEDAATIVELCAKAGFDDKAEDFVRDGLAVDAVRARLFDLMVEAQADIRTAHADKPAIKPRNQYSASELAAIYRQDPQLYRRIMEQPE